MRHPRSKNTVIIQALKHEVSEEQIARRAYERWVARGSPIGDGREDWFAAKKELEAEAEREAMRKSKPKKARTRKDRGEPRTPHRIEPGRPLSPLRA